MTALQDSDLDQCPPFPRSKPVKSGAHPGGCVTPLCPIGWGPIGVLLCNDLTHNYFILLIKKMKYRVMSGEGTPVGHIQPPMNVAESEYSSNNFRNRDNFSPSRTSHFYGICRINFPQLRVILVTLSTRTTTTNTKLPLTS